MEKIEPFDESVENWISYVEQLEEYFKMSKVDNKIKVSASLSLVGGKTYSLLRNLTLTDKPTDKNFDDIVKILKKHLSPKPSIIAELFRFHRRQQQEGESFNEYAAVLKK